LYTDKRLFYKMIYQKTFPDLKKSHPREDFFLSRRNIFAIADGITRDPLGFKDFSGHDWNEMSKSYPNPSGAALAAKKFCQSFVKSISKIKKIDLKAVRQAFLSANHEIGKLNQKNVPKVDYLENDFWACVAAGGVIHQNILFWGAITDCGLAIYKKSGQKKFQTKNWMRPFEKYLAKNPIPFAKPEVRRKIRSEFRNKLKMTHRGKPVGYGALTGEKEAKKFMHFGKVELEKEDLVIFYTDGFEKVISQKDFFKNIYFPKFARSCHPELDLVSRRKKNLIPKQVRNDALKNTKIIEKRFVPFSLKLAEKDPPVFGRERTIIAKIF